MSNHCYCYRESNFACASNRNEAPRVLPVVLWVKRSGPADGTEICSNIPIDYIVGAERETRNEKKENYKKKRAGKGKISMLPPIQSFRT